MSTDETRAAEDEEFLDHVEELPYPHTLACDARGYEMLRVIEDMNKNIHVALSDSFDYAEDWGSYLAEVAQVVARDYSYVLETRREDGDLFAAVLDGFLMGWSAGNQRPVEADGQGSEPTDESPEDRVPESWLCVDCGINTAPGLFNRDEMEEDITARVAGEWSGIEQTFDDRTEVYIVRRAVWARAGMMPMGGCLCVGCLEKCLGRRLRPGDFKRDDPLNQVPTGTVRLLQRQKR
jgi:hypothetical protein